MGFYEKLWKVCGRLASIATAHSALVLSVGVWGAAPFESKSPGLLFRVYSNDSGDEQELLIILSVQPNRSVHIFVLQIIITVVNLIHIGYQSNILWTFFHQFPAPMQGMVFVILITLLTSLSDSNTFFFCSESCILLCTMLESGIAA